MNEYPWYLEPYEQGGKNRYTCPSCGKKKEFARYIYADTGEQIADHVGRCNRLNKCNYHKSPPEYFEECGFNQKSHWRPLNKSWGAKAVQQSNNHQKEIPSFIPFELFEKSLMPGRSLNKIASKNNFINFLLSNFGKEITLSLIETYLIGTTKRWKGGTIFWQIDQRGNIRTGKLMHYDPDTGKRYDNFNWAHSLKYGSENFNLHQCLFGEHLLKNEVKPVAIAEGEKTAIIASIYLPQFIWLAAGNKGNLKLENCYSVSNRNVVLFPDLGAFNDWREKAEELRRIANVEISDLLEQKATQKEKEQGLDLADYLLRFPLKSYKQADSAGECQPFTNHLNQRHMDHDPEGLLRLSGLDFLCDYETEAESTFESMAIKNPKLFRLRNKLGLKPDE